VNQQSRYDRNSLPLSINPKAWETSYLLKESFRIRHRLVASGVQFSDTVNVLQGFLQARAHSKPCQAICFQPSFRARLHLSKKNLDQDASGSFNAIVRFVLSASMVSVLCNCSSETEDISYQVKLCSSSQAAARGCT